MQLKGKGENAEMMVMEETLRRYGWVNSSITNLQPCNLITVRQKIFRYLTCFKIPCQFLISATTLISTADYH